MQDAENTNPSLPPNAGAVDAITAADYDPAYEKDAATNAEIVNAVLDDCLGAEMWHPPEPPNRPISLEYDGYTAERHIMACKFVALGLTFEHAARAIGVNPKTLKSWREKYPALNRDFEQARWLAVGTVAKIVREIIRGEDKKLALQAAMFFLRTRAPEFREKVEAAAELNFADIAKKVSRDIYGQTSAGRAHGANMIEGDATAANTATAAKTPLLSSSAAAAPARPLDAGSEAAQ